MRWWAGAWTRGYALAAVAVLALSGCGASPPAAAPPSSGDGAQTVAAPTGIVPGSPPVKHDGGTLAWVPPGPVDPADPPQSQWYVLLQAKDCDGLAAAVDAGNATTPDGFALWSAATAACRAVYQGQVSGWTEAAAGLAALQQPGQDHCLDRAAYDLVAALVAFHSQNPAAAPSPEVGSGTACPLGLTGLDALDGQGPTATPSSGLAGGRFQLAGRFLDVVAVMVGGQRVAAEADPDQPGRWDIVIPPAAATGTVRITAEGSSGALPGSLTFTYLDDTATPPVSTAPEAPGTTTAVDGGAG
ncbi:hypothetical protein CVV68_13920 [Arthrobacter livingstonensis]|uniref:IPT/TIG domain-containing protein n=1 Tax=Arthrobacter livingstonensis TaxID=670078 RepID=A0A2V5L5E7_9MICC|nr:hypothetical protein [Arthrobacter livingstonensis]PYI66398.1 hypothetical protein CVV68_13920 [Arthrobacter livingstonensis]